MKRFVRPARLKGKIAAPASKSLAQRALLLSSMLDGPSTIELSSLCDDTERCSEAVAGLGSDVKYSNGMFEVVPKSKPVKSQIDCGESGTCFRMIAALCARFDQSIELIGHGTLLTRPMQMGVVPLEQLGARVSTNNGKLPIHICGPLKAGTAEVDGSISSQFLSGLLLALPFSSGNYVLKVTNLKSKPYVELTLGILKEAGIELHYSADYKYFQIEGDQKAKGKYFKIEGDWSSIATLLVAGAVAGELEIDNVKKESAQADRAVLVALENAGAKLAWNENTVKISAPNGLVGFNFDAEDCPDAIPALVALAVNCKGRSEISGAGRLTHKESDRASVLCSEFAKVGGLVSSEGNKMVVLGSKIQGGEVSSHGDHRIAMSLAIAGLTSINGIQINDSHAVAKSYPEFFTDIENNYL